MSRDASPRSRAAVADATNHREREASDLRAYADHREPRARERLILNYLPLRPLRGRPIQLDCCGQGTRWLAADLAEWP
jgi:hypothetical protein